MSLLFICLKKTNKIKYLEGEKAKKVLDLLKGDAEQTYNNYETMLNERYDGSKIDENSVGLARELARICLLYTSPSPRD